jgi:2-methylcitrate dehydratase PrpD
MNFEDTSPQTALRAQPKPRQDAAPAVVSTASGVSAALVRAATRIDYDDLPAGVVATVKRVLLDTLAVAWAGQDAAGVDAARHVALRSGLGRASLWGTESQRREPAAAAFANGAAAAALDFDSLAGSVHADIVVAPAALAVAEQERRNGRDLVTALAIGSELATRIGAAVDTRKGWFLTSVGGVFGAALAASRLLGHDGQRTGDALGIALCHAGGTQQSHIEQRLTKRLQSAFAARDGIVCADLAGLGISGPAAALEGQFGLFALFEQGTPEAVVRGFGERFLLNDTALKRFPACACNHAAFQATLDLVAAHGIGAADVTSGEIVITPHMARLVAFPFVPEPNPQVTGQFNLRYGVAAILLRGHFGLSDIAPEAVLDPAIRPVVARLEVRVDESRTGAHGPVDITLLTADGRRLHRHAETLPGGVEAPLGAAEFRAKLFDCFGHGRSALRRDAIDALIDRVERLEQLADVSTLFEGLH